MDKSAINQRFTDAIIFLISQKIADSKTNIAEKIKISKSKFSEILKNRMNVGSDTLALFSIEYGVSSEWLLTGRGSMLRSDKESQSTNQSVSGNGNLISGSNIKVNSDKRVQKPAPETADNALVAQLAEKDKQINNLIEQQSRFLEQQNKLVEQIDKLVEQQSKLISKL